MFASESKNPHEIKIHRRREGVFFLLSGLFLGTLTLLNILGITRFLDLSFSFFGMNIPFAVAVGVLPYPVTFLCTDFISEFYGQRRANMLVWVGLLLNIWVVFILWLGGTLPGFEVANDLVETVSGLEGFSVLEPEKQTEINVQMNRPGVYFEVKTLAFGAVTASMIAYLIAQFIDVRLFHFWKRLTKGKHLWIRNNGSTLVSQLVDSTAVVLITHYYAHALPVNGSDPIGEQLMVFIFSAYLFKMACALVDTVPFYIGSRWLEDYLEIDPLKVS